MASEFSGKIISVQYIDSGHTLMKVVYDDNGSLSVFDLDANHAYYPELEKEGWDTEKIIEETAAIKQAQSAAFNAQVSAAAKILLEEKFGYTDSGENSVNSNFSWDHFFDTMNTDKDEMFKFKIWAFESERMKEASAELKRDLRKAQTFIEAIKIYEQLL
jgi:hypothetical protein